MCSKIFRYHIVLGFNSLQCFADSADHSECFLKLRWPISISCGWITAPPFLVVSTCNLFLRKTWDFFFSHARLSLPASLCTVISCSVDWFTCFTAHCQSCAVYATVPLLTPHLLASLSAVKSCAVDAIRSKEDGKEYIIELNGNFWVIQRCEYC